MTALAELGSYVASSGRETASGALRELVELHVVDTVAAWIASAPTAEGSSLLRFRAAMRADGRAGGAAALDLATRCALARMSEIDDIHLPSMTTPGAIVIPAALTLAGAAKPGDVIAAILAGYEAMTRLGRAIDGPTVLYRGIWPTYFAAPFGVAAVAARLLELDAKQAANALALALTFAAPGVGHHNAATRLALARRRQRRPQRARRRAGGATGFTSDLELVDGNFLAGVYGVTPDVAALTDGLGERVALAEVSFKPWCAARQTMAATQALNEIIASGIAPAAMSEIEVAVLPPHRKMIDHGVKGGDRASHLTSLQYCMAVAALAPEHGDSMSGARRRSHRRPFAASWRRSRSRRTRACWPIIPARWPARVRVTAGSEQHERLVSHVPGDPARPFDRAQVRTS